MDSDDYENKEEKIRILTNQIKPFSQILDTEFELFNVNGFANQRLTVPGASSWDYKLAIKLSEEDISKWIVDMEDTTIENYDYGCTIDIVKNRKQSWQVKSTPKFYTRGNSNIITLVYKDEGVIFKRIKNL